MRRFGFALIFVVALAALVGCGPSGSGEGRQLEQAMISALEEQISEEAPLVELRSVTCRELSTGEEFSCAAFLGIDGDAFKVSYAVEVDGDDCWTARTREIAPLRAGPSPLPPETASRSTDLSGCFR